SSNPTPNDLYNYCIGYRGAINFKLGLFKQSQLDLENAIELKPDYSYWHCQFGALLYKQRNYDASLKELNHAISLFQSSKSKSQPLNKFQKVLMSEAHYYRGLLYKAIKDHQMANSDFKKAFELNPDLESQKID
ncbi:8086_t:CDS:1, partial [Scutellospora calospora]